LGVAIYSPFLATVATDSRSLATLP
jgi:hypothetical protein